MPYKSAADAPEWVQKKGDAAAKMWIEVFNAAFKEHGGDEAKAFGAAGAAVKKKYAAEFTRTFVESFPETFDGTKVRVQLFPVGHWEGHADGPLDITVDDLKAAVRNFEGTGRALPVDFDHGLDYGSTPEERRAAGWIKELEVTDAGLFATFDATDEAAEWIKGGQYRFISPTYTYDYTNKDSGESQGFTLLRAGLTNTPWFDGMFPCVAMNERTKGALTEAIMADYAKNWTVGIICKAGTPLDEVSKWVEAAGHQMNSAYREMIMKEPPNGVKTEEDEAIVARSFVWKEEPDGIGALTLTEV